MSSGVKLLAAGTATTIAAGLALGLLSYAVYKAGKLIKKYRNKQLAEKHARRIHGQIKLIKMRKRRKI